MFISKITDMVAETLWWSIVLGCCLSCARLYQMYHIRIILCDSQRAWTTMLVIPYALGIFTVAMSWCIHICHYSDHGELDGSDIATHFATSFSRLHNQFHRSTSSTKAHSLLQILSETVEPDVQLHCVTELGQASTVYALCFRWTLVTRSPAVRMHSNGSSDAMSICHDEKADNGADHSRESLIWYKTFQWTDEDLRIETSCIVLMIPCCDPLQYLLSHQPNTQQWTFTISYVTL